MIKKLSKNHHLYHCFILSIKGRITWPNWTGNIVLALSARTFYLVMWALKSQTPSELSDIYSFDKCNKLICLKIDKQEHICPPAVGRDSPCKLCHKHKRLTLLGDRCAASNPCERFQTMVEVSINLDLILNEWSAWIFSVHVWEIQASLRRHTRIL